MFVNKLILIMNVFLTYFGSNILCYDLKQSKIIGGRDAVAGEAPYQVSLQRFSNVTNSWRHFCGGSIIRNKWIVTAGHCIVYGLESQTISPEKVRIRYGSLQYQTGGHVIYVKKAIRHEKYAEDAESANYDIALLKTNETIILGTKLSDKIKLACKGSDPRPGTAIITSGFGLTQDGATSVSPNLKIVKTHVVERSKCNADYGNYTTFGVTKKMICSSEPTGGKGACQGDSGGPLVINKRLEGIVSWVWDLCADASHPAVSTRVGVFVDWIKGKVGNDCCL